MELKSAPKKIFDFIQKYKYVLLILLIGIVFMMLPNSDQSSKQKARDVTVNMQQVSVGKELETLLAHTEGVGAVKVLLTTGRGEETVYQMDTDHSSGESGSGIRSNTVTITDSERSQSGLVKQVNPPTYLGAVVICQGADDPEVRLSVVNAVSKATGLGANKISVLKMK